MYIYLIIFLLSLSFSQISDYSFTGAETSAMAGAVVSEEGNIWNIFHNPAGLTEVKNTSFSAGNSNLYGYRWLPTYYLTGILLTPINSKIAFSIEQFETTVDGISLSTEQTLSIANAYELQKDNNSHLSVGYSANFIQWKLGKSSGLSGDGSDGIALGNINTITVDLGVLASLRKKYRFGVFIKNINSGAAGKGMTRQILPRRINTGITYMPIKTLSTSIVSEYYLGKENMHVKGSMRYSINPFIQIFAGAQSNPNRLGLGIQIALNKNLKNNYTFSYGLLTHPILPVTHQFAIGFVL